MGQNKCENTILYTYKMKWYEMKYKNAWVQTDQNRL